MAKCEWSGDCFADFEGNLRFSADFICFFNLKLLDSQISLVLLAHQPSINCFGGACVITIYALFQQCRIVKRKNSIEKGITVKGEFLSF